MFTSWLDNLKIRYKLQLLLVPLALLLLALSTNTAMDRWQRYAAAHTSLESRDLIQLFTNLVYELQLERGISLGYIGSDGDLFVEQLRQQRRSVDVHVTLVRDFIGRHTSAAHNIFDPHMLEKALEQMDSLAAARSLVDAKVAREAKTKTFRYYSDFNAHVLHMIQHVSLDIDDTSLIRRANAFGILLWLQEYAGMERALLSGVFASGTLDVATLQEVQGNIANQERLLDHFNYSAASLEQVAMLQQALDDPVVERVYRMRQALLLKGIKSDLLLGLKTIIGYGELIHEFDSNAIGDVEVYRRQFRRQFAKLREVLQQYRNLPSISAEEVADLAVIEETFNKYAHLLLVDEGTRGKGDGAGKIDRLVRMDSTPAIAALDRLQGSLSGIKAEEWFRYASRRIELIRQVSDRIGEEMAMYAKQAKDTAYEGLVFYSVIIIVSLVVTLFLSVVITRRLVSGLTNINEALNIVRDTGDLTVQLRTQGDDEISRMKRSFNSMIDERKRIDQELRQSQRKLQLAMEGAESANKAKSEFLSRMSHELRTPMNAILGFAQLLECDDGLGTDQKKEVREILKAGAHLLDLINDVLDLSRIESGHINVAFQDVDCHMLLADALQLVKPLAVQRNITLHYEPDLSDKVSIHVDPMRLKEVLLNLLSNAIKYNRKDGEVTVSCRKSSDHYYRIEVSDTGEGLSEEQMQRLFRPFERLGAENSTIEGSGIGLVICKRILATMGGSIGVESEPGRGSTFWIEVKTHTEVHESGGDPLVEEEGGKVSCSEFDCLALYIEDNPSNLRLMEYIFDKYTNIPLISAMTPEEGLALVKAHRPGLVLMDINLPGMDGIELMKLVRGCDGVGEVVVVAVSANAMPQDIKKAMDAGFDDYLTKPVDIAHLIKLLPELLQKPSP